MYFLCNLFDLSLLTDIDECNTLSPCDSVSEKCINEDGSYKCKCKAGYTRHQGKCTEWEEAERLRNQLQDRDNKKKKKRSKTATNEGNEEMSHDRRVFPWYHLLLPVALSYLGRRFVRPTLGTSVGIIFSVVAIYLIAQKL